MARPAVHVIAPASLSTEIDQVAADLTLDVRTSPLPDDERGGDAAALRRRLQAIIDEVSGTAEVSQIVVACGVGGGATTGLHARHVPLALPRRHETISDHLDADADTAGAADAGDAPIPPPPDGSGEPPDPASPDDATTAAFLEGWRQFYQRTAYLDLQTPEQRRHARIAADLAARHGWTREPSQASPPLRRLLTAQHSDAELLWTPPHHATAWDAERQRLRAVPVWELGADDEAARDQVIEIGAADDSGGPTGLGLGIDAGGTYTDVVLYAFDGDRVVEKAKALTTRWDYTHGIADALDQLDPAGLRQVELVSVSTTLATNAVVEGVGQKVGLLIMPPYGLFDDGDITHRPIAVIAGQMGIDGVERSPIDPDEVRRAARQMVEQQQVGAFAVVGFAGTVNPEHELAVRRVVEAETGLSVTCGHEISEQLNYRVRAQTAALNGRIIPILVAFLRQAAEGLRARGIDAPLMVVRSDGSLMSVETAGRRPIETILSGPAASVAGARHLAGTRDAIVVDVGGTTTDTAVIRRGEVRTNPHGARVGGWQTHVQALDMRTCGLGGDSLVTVSRKALQLGPRRVCPVAWLGAHGGELGPCFDWIEAQLEKDASLSPGLMDIYALNGHAGEVDLGPREQRAIDALARRPHSAHELSSVALEHWWESVDLDRLERLHVVRRCGLTPTDVFHATGRFQRWDPAAAQRLLALMGAAAAMGPADLAARVQEHFVRRLALEVLKKQLDGEVDADGLEATDAGRALLDNWLSGGSAGLAVQVRLEHPVIGVGAPVAQVLPEAAERLRTRAIVPEHADVANALGAITSSVVIHRQVEICPDMHGRYSVHGMPHAPTFAELHEARAAAMRYLQDHVTNAARAAGTSRSRIRFTVRDRVAPLNEGGQAFIGQTIEARLTGRPDLARLTPAAP